MEGKLRQGGQRKRDGDGRVDFKRDLVTKIRAPGPMRRMCARGLKETEGGFA